MALLPDPTTAASERSSVKNRLTGSSRRGSGINRHRSRTVSKTSLKGVQAQGAGASKGGGGAGPEPLQPAVKHEKLDKRSVSVKPNTQLHPGLCAGGCSKTNGSRYSLGARSGLPTWLQPASSTSPWFFCQALSEVFSKESSVMSSLLFLYSPKSCKLQIVPASKRKERRLSHGFVTGSYNSCI